MGRPQASHFRFLPLLTRVQLLQAQPFIRGRAAARAAAEEEEGKVEEEDDDEEEEEAAAAADCVCCVAACVAGCSRCVARGWVKRAEGCDREDCEFWTCRAIAASFFSRGMLSRLGPI